jgi:hypothetical protein
MGGPILNVQEFECGALTVRICLLAPEVLLRQPLMMWRWLLDGLFLR